MNLYSSVLTIETGWRIWLKEVKTRMKVLETCMSHLENTSMWQVLIEWWFSSSFNLLSEKRNPQKIAFSHFATRKRILLPRGGRFSRRYQALFVAQALSEKSHVEFSIKLPLFFHVTCNCLRQTFLLAVLCSWLPETYYCSNSSPSNGRFLYLLQNAVFLNCTKKHSRYSIFTRTMDHFEAATFEYFSESSIWRFC